MKKFLSIVLIAMLIVTLNAAVFAAGAPTQKEEVVYGILRSDGSIQSVYAVNSFKGGMIADYGNYSEVSNMTSSEKLTQQGDMITVNTAADRFYYQGTLQSKELPWNIDIRYRLDGKGISSSELAGKNGALEISIAITQNKKINHIFYENYMLQLTLTMDTERCKDIVSPNATLASAGKNKMIVHTVLPGNDADITVSASVEDFIMNSMEISAMPLAMFIEMPDTGSLTEDMTGLSDAVNDLKDGMKKLSDGITKTNSGARKLTEGSADFESGLSELSGNSEALLNASAQIKKALANIVKVFDGETANYDLSDISALPGGLRQLADGLTEITAGMKTLKSGYASAYFALDLAISSIPETDIDPSGLYEAISGDEVLTGTLDRLIEYYAAAKAVKDTYAAVREAFSLVESSLDGMIDSVKIIAGALSQTADKIEQSLSKMDFAAELQQLKTGLSKISNNYIQLHTGLDNYMSGVERLADGYGEVNTGIRSLAGGIRELNTGASGLYEGTSELNDAVAVLPDTIRNEIDKIFKQYDKSDFAPVSFVSAKNTNVTAVQFVLKTSPIELPETPEYIAPEPVKLNSWQKLLRLFGLYT